MNFINIFFPLFIIVIVSLYWLLKKEWRNIFLLVVSFAFYAWYSVPYAVLLAVMSITAYFAGILLGRKQIKWGLAIAVILNFTPLFLFKACSFADASNMLHHIVIPMGLSYYSFKSVSYLVDVYKGKAPVERNIAKFVLFVSFFPEILVGPIDRAGNLLHQINHLAAFDYRKFKKGIFYISIGYFQKLVIADRIGVFVDAVYADTVSYVGIYTWMAILLYSMQIYMDFAGCTSIARGIGLMLGFDLPKNFDRPYLSTGIAEFWRKWHISLTSWLRDYVYIPLGGNRKGTVRKWANTLITFTLSGLWHGNDISFLVWGFLNGFLLLVGNATLALRNRVWSFLHVDTAGNGLRIVRGIGTYIWISFTWVFFRAESMGQALQIFKNLIAKWNIWILFGSDSYSFVMNYKNWYLLVACLLGIALLSIYQKKNRAVIESVLDCSYPIQLMALYVVIFSVVIFGMYGAQYSSSNFIYMNF